MTRGRSDLPKVTAYLLRATLSKTNKTELIKCSIIKNEAIMKETPRLQAAVSRLLLRTKGPDDKALELERHHSEAGSISLLGFLFVF